jgi:molybdopterin converting factor small subunit
VKVIIHAYKDGRKLYFRGDHEVSGKTTLENALRAIGDIMGEPLIEIVQDPSDYTIILLNDKVMDFKDDRNRIVTNEDSLKLFPQVVGG